MKRVSDGYAFTAVLGSAIVTFIFKEHIVAETQSDAMRDLLEVAKDVRVQVGPALKTYG